MSAARPSWPSPGRPLRRAVAAVLLLPLVATGPASAEDGGPSPEARAAFDEGRALWSTRKAADLQASLIPLQRTIELAPDWAPGHAALADSLALLGLYGAMPAGETLPLAGAAAARALELDDQLGAAHASLGLTLYLHLHDYSGAEASFRRALALDPGNHSAHHWLAMLLSVRKRHDEAVTHIDQALHHAPGSKLLCGKKAAILRQAGRFDGALSQLLECTEKHGETTLFVREKASVLLEQGQTEAAQELLLRALELSPGDLRCLSLLGYAAGTRGDEALRKEVEEAFGEISAERYVPVSALAGPAVGAGDLERAFRALREGLDQGEAGLVYLGTRPELLPLRADPRFLNLLGRLGLTRTE